LGSFENKDLLHRYWFEFETRVDYFGAWFGVTAYNYDDAISVLNKWVFNGKTMPPLKKMAEDVNVESLDAGHVLPNIGVVAVRGIWYPRMPESQT
jgi:hypothetical protein